MNETTLPSLSPGFQVARIGQIGAAYDVDAEQIHLLDADTTSVALACATADRVDNPDRPQNRTADTADEPAGTATSTEAALEKLRAIGCVGRNDPAQHRPPTDTPVDPFSPDDHSVLIRAGQHVIRLRSQSRELIRLSVWRLGLVIDDDSPDTEATGQFCLSRTPGGGIRLLTDTEHRFANRRELLANWLAIVYDFVNRSPDTLVFHAAALAHPGGATVVLPAHSDSGKSTLSAACAQQGWTYLSDEAGVLTPGTLELLPYAKGITIDNTSRRALGIYRRLPGMVGDVKVRRLSPGAVPTRHRYRAPTAVMLPSYAPGEPSTLRRLDIAEAVSTLTPTTTNLPWAGQTGFTTLGELIERVPVFAFTYPDTDEAIAVMSSVLTDTAVTTTT